MDLSARICASSWPIRSEVSGGGLVICFVTPRFEVAERATTNSTPHRLSEASE